VDSSNYNNLIDNQITADGNCIDIKDSENVLVSKNTISSNNGLGIAIQDSNNAKVVGNNVISKEESIYIGGNSHNNEVRGNDVNSVTDSGAAIFVNGATDANTVIASNVVTSGYNGIKLINTSNNTISGNEVSQCVYNGLYLNNAPNSIIEKNVVKSNYTCDIYDYAGGIYIYNSDNCKIIQNKISDNYIAGISIRCSNDCNIIGNKISNNGFWKAVGLRMDYASDCNIIDNAFTSNGHGLAFVDSTSNTITRNQVMDNTWHGIYVWDSNDNKIYHNILVDNGYNAGVRFSDGTSLKNYWDNGYECDVNHPSGGNFWGDLKDVHDDYCGPDQDDPNGDYEAHCAKYGIVDTPYYIKDYNGDEDPCNIDGYPILLVSYKITKPDRAVMKEPYKLKVELINNTADLFEPGLDIDVNGIEQMDPPEPASVFKNKWDLDYNIDIYALLLPREIPLDETPVLLARTFRNNWNWIKPQDWKSVVMGIILGKVSTKYSIASFIGSCFDARKAVPHLTYTFEPYRSPLVLFSSDVKVDVQQEKPVYLHGSIVAEGASIVCSICAAACTIAWNLPAATAFTRAAALYTIESIGFYYLAEDPDKNYTEICLPRTVSPPGEVEELPETERRLAQAALDIACLVEAYKESYTRYDGAKEDGSSEYMELQLNAAIRYNAMATKKLEELQFLNGVVIAGMPEPNDNDVNDFRTEIDVNGLPEVQREILEMFDFNEPDDPNDPNAADIREVILAVTNPDDPNAKAMRDACNDPNNLLRYTQLLIQDHYIADYALRAAAKRRYFTVLEPEQAISPLAFGKEGQATDFNIAYLPGWFSGCSAAWHDVYFGEDFSDVNDANTTVDSNSVYKGRQEGTSYNFSGLELGTTYYWRIDELYNVRDTSVVSKGIVYEFTVNHLVVDDMEDYNDTNLIRDTWKDGNDTGSMIWLMEDPWPVHADKQSMGYVYDNRYDWGAGYSEIEATTADLGISPHWAGVGAKALTLYFYGDPNNDVNDTEQMYVGLEDSLEAYKEARYEDMNDINLPEWQEWNIDLEDFNKAGVDLNNVSKVYIGFGDRGNQEEGGSGTVYFDDIRLYIPRHIPEYAPEGDFTGDSVVDYEDLQIMTGEWLSISDYSMSDVYKDDDNRVNFKDFAALANHWMEEQLWPAD